MTRQAHGTGRARMATCTGGLVRVGSSGALLAGGLLLAACSGPGPGGVSGLPGVPSATVTTAGGPRGALDEATFTVDDGADAVDVTVADLGPDLYRVSTATGARVLALRAGRLGSDRPAPGAAGPPRAARQGPGGPGASGARLRVVSRAWRRGADP